MDPVSALGLAASIIAVLQLTSALIEPATSALGPSENDKEELNRLQTTMTGFQAAYTNLEKYLKSNPGAADTLLTAIKKPIQECKEVLAELKRRLSTMTFVRRNIIGKKWDKDYKRLVKRLDDARQLFDVILQGDQSERLIKISQFMAQRSEDIGEIKKGVQVAEQRLAEIHLTVDTNQSELRSMMDGYQNRIDEHFSILKRGEQRKQKDDILRWLMVADPRSNYDSACASHKPGTGDWFTQGQRYRTWLSEPKSFFWLNGKAGCGKTILSSTIIKNTTAYCDKNEGCVLAYFYFSFTDSAKQLCSNMLRSLITQIASQVDVTPDCLTSLHQAYQRSTPPTETLKASLQSLLDEMPFRHVYIIVDAIDEIPDTEGREEACKILKELSQSPNAHILTTSRREYDIIECMSEYNSITDISIQNPQVDHDIQLYVRQRLNEDKKLKKWSAVHSEIEDVLSTQADGMFRWAACQLDSLKKCLSAKSVRNALKSLPKTLDETYERILLAIDEEYRDVAIEALRWLCFSTEVLTIEELAEAAVFSATVQAPSKETPFEVSFDVSDRIEDPRDILNILSGLVVYRPPDDDDGDKDEDSEDHDEDFESSDEDYPPSIVDQHPISNDDLEPLPLEHARKRSRILLSHFSVKEYLVSGRLRCQVEPFAMDERRAHEILATRCLYYILFSQQFLECHKRTRWKRYPYQRHPSSPLFPYASGRWEKHARSVEDESELAFLIIALLKAEMPLKGCLLMSEYDDSEEECQTLTLIYLVSYLGLYWPCKSLVETGADVNSEGGYYGSALQAALFHGHGRIVQLLLDHGANVNLEGGYYGNALQAASSNGSKSIVQLLLDHGANVNLEGGYYGNALQAALSNGSESIVQLLLDHGANVNLEGGCYGNALQAASINGSESKVQLLLDHGANVNLEGGHYGNALQAASYYSSESKVQLLLDHGADVNSEGGHYGNALQAASYCSSESIVQLLLDHGANVNLEGGHYGNALQAASYCSSESIVQLLLDHGANVNLEGGHYGNALQAALSNSSKSKVQLLLDHGADVNSEGGHYGNALQAASYCSSKSIVQLLLNHGANVNLEGGHYGNALQAALINGSKSIVQLLLDHGADINLEGGYYGNALQAASRLGHESIVQLLFKNGANLPIGEDLWITFALALMNRYTSIAQILLDHGAEIDLQERYEEAMSRKNTKLAVALLGLGVVLTKYDGGSEAEEALARKDFEGFVDIQIQCLEERLGDGSDWESC